MARAERTPSSGPSGHFPLIGGIVLPLWRGKAYGRTLCAPTEKKKRAVNVLWERESPRRFAAPPFDKGALWKEHIREA